jgi:hypothetical protein
VPGLPRAERDNRILGDEIIIDNVPIGREEMPIPPDR